MKAEIAVENITFGGCAAPIQKEWRTIEDVDTVEVNVNSGTVTIQYFDLSITERVRKRLNSLGYPEKGSQHGLGKTTFQRLKSVVCCAVG